MNENVQLYRGYGKTWIEAGLDGAPAASRDEPEPTVREQPAPQGSLGAWAQTGDHVKQDQRAADLYALDQLLRENDLSDYERGAFENMNERLARGRYPLTEKQRTWVLGRCEELGVDADLREHAERNANVPRGREVATPGVLQGLPKDPPGRRRPEPSY